MQNKQSVNGEVCILQSHRLSSYKNNLQFILAQVKYLTEFLWYSIGVLFIHLKWTFLSLMTRMISDWIFQWNVQLYDMGISSEISKWRVVVWILVFIQIITHENDSLVLWHLMLYWQQLLKPFYMRWYVHYFTPGRSRRVESDFEQQELDKLKLIRELVQEVVQTWYVRPTVLPKGINKKRNLHKVN